MEQFELTLSTPESVVYRKSIYLPQGDLCYSINVEQLSNKVAFGCRNNILIYNSILEYEIHTSFEKNIRSVAHCTKRNELYSLKTNRAVESMSADCFTFKHTPTWIN